MSHKKSVASFRHLINHTPHLDKCVNVKEEYKKVRAADGEELQLFFGQKDHNSANIALEFLHVWRGNISND